MKRSSTCRGVKMLKEEPNLLACCEEDIVRIMKRIRITRIMRAAHFLSMINSSRNYLSKILKWQDVYECYAAQLKIRNCGVRNLLRDYYGQCWSFRTEESELLWNARDCNDAKYKHDVVMIETTVYDFVNSIKGVQRRDGYASGFVSIGAVEYTLPKVLSASDVKFTLSSDANLTSSLFLKRPQFSDEDELRLVFNIRGRTPRKSLSYKILGGMLSYELKNTKMIRRVVCHPLMSKRRFDVIQKAISQSSWTVPIVVKSDLYRLPKQVFNIF